MPPRVEGGILGALASSAVVAAEVLVAMLANLLSGVVRLFHFLVEKLLRRSGGFFARALGLLVFLSLMVALGFTVMMVGMLFLSAAGIDA